MGDLNPLYLWLIAGLVLLVAEALGITGAGLMFGGLGAIVTGGALYMGMVSGDAVIAQFLIFFAATAALTILLWKPLQKHLHKKNAYQNIIGQTAYVGSSGLTQSRGGEVTWSGTIMKARLAKGVVEDAMEAGAQVTVVEISGNTLIVRPKE